MKYPLSVRLIHWFSALIILALLIMGVAMTPFDMDNPALSESLYFWHKSFGILALLFVMVRIFNRTRHDLPELPEGMAAHEKLGAKLAHKALYILMVLVPVLGYVQSSTYEFSSGVHFFLIDLPELFPKDKELFEVTNTIHKWLAYLLIVVIIAHVGGALKHRFFESDENDVLKRML